VDNSSNAEDTIKDGLLRYPKSAPGSWRSPDGDVIWMFEDVPYTAKFLTDSMTVYHAMSDERVVGVKFGGTAGRLDREVSSIYAVEVSNYDEYKIILVEGPVCDFKALCDSLQREAWQMALLSAMENGLFVCGFEWQDAMTQLLARRGYREVEIPTYQNFNVGDEPMRALVGDDLVEAIRSHDKRIWAEPMPILDEAEYRQNLQSEKSEVKKILDSLPKDRVIERTGLEARLKKIDLLMEEPIDGKEVE
jgi:hypothetical protein